MNSISSEDMLLLLDKWKAESVLLRIVSTNSIGTFNGIGVLTAFDTETLRVEDGKLWAWLIRYSSATCSYSDPREAPSANRMENQTKYECCLDLQFPPSADQVILMQLKETA